jgi:putative ABC transport system permease protein
LIKGVRGLAKRLGADILIVPAGFDKTVEGVLLRGEPSTFYMDAGWTDKLASVEGVKSASPQLFVAALNSSCCSYPVQIIGFEQDTDFVIAPWIKSNKIDELKNNEIVVGSAIMGDVGEKLLFFDREYIIAARTESTGTGFDASVFMNMEAARIAAENYVVSGGKTLPPNNTISSVILELIEGYTPLGVINIIHNQFGYASEIVPIPSNQILGTVSIGLNSMLRVIVIMTVIVCMLAAVALTVIFSVIHNERVGEYAMLRSIGATKGKVLKLIITESFLASFTGAAVGVALSVLIIFPFKVMINELFAMPYMQPSAMQVLGLLAGSLAVSALLGPIASMLASVKIIGRDTYLTLKELG